MTETHETEVKFKAVVFVEFVLHFHMYLATKYHHGIVSMLLLTLLRGSRFWQT